MDDSIDSGNFSLRGYLPLIRKDSVNVWSIIRTVLPIVVELIDLVNSVIIFLPQMTLFRSLIFLFGSLSVALEVLFFWINLFLLTLEFVLAFPLLGNSDHGDVSVSINLPLNSEGDASFHCSTYDYSRADLDDLHDDFRDIHGRISLNSDCAVGTEFCEWGQVGINLYIPCRNYQVLIHLHCFQLLVLLP